MLRLWAVVLTANMVGAFIFAFTISQTEMFEPNVRGAFAEIGREALKNWWALTMLKGIFAGWLIAMMVWMLPASESARFFVVIVMTYLVALGGFAHIIAGAVEVFYVVLTGAAQWGDYFRWALPTLAGNREGLAPCSGWAGRAHRAHHNMLESLVLFAALVLIAVVSQKTNSTTLLGAQIFFWARVAYALVYVAGLPWLRTGVWFISVIGLALIFFQLL